VIEDVEREEIEASNGSLASRAAGRRQEISERKAVVLEVPGYEGVLAVEYRALTYSEGRKIAARHQRQSDDAVRELYTAVDQLIRASVNSYELLEDGSKRELGVGWGRDLAMMLGVEIYDQTTARQAVLASFANDVLMTRHYIDYSEWLQNVQEEIDEEQRVDFPRTTSQDSPTTQ